MTYRALLIGNSVFDADAGLQPLNAPAKDVARLHRALVDNDVGMFDDAHVRLVIERSCNDVLDELDQFFDAGRKDDLLLLYYSGHGVLDERNHLYLCGRDTRSDRLLRTAISNTRINEFIAQCVSQQTVILLDCCSSGMFKGGPVGGQLAGPGRYIISSSRGAALANDAATATGTSLFTDYLVEGLLGGATDSNNDGYVDLREVYDFVRDRLSASTTQVPHCRFDGDAAVSLSRSRPSGRPQPDTSHALIGQARPVTFILAENSITLRDVLPDEWLPAETVEIVPLTGDNLDLSSDSEDDWVRTWVNGLLLVIDARPAPGTNRAKITVRDRDSGSTAVLRFTVRVRSPQTPPATAHGLDRAPPEQSADSASGDLESSTKSARVPSSTPPISEPRVGAAQVDAVPPARTRGVSRRRRWPVILAAAGAAVIIAAGAFVVKQMTSASPSARSPSARSLLAGSPLAASPAATCGSTQDAAGSGSTVSRTDPDGSSHCDIFGIGSDGLVYQNAFNKGAWAGWHALPGESRFKGTPAVTYYALNGAPHYDLFAVDTHGALEQIGYNNGQWGGWKGSQFTDNEPAFTGGAAAIYHDANGARYYDVFSIGADHSIYQNSLIAGNNKWSGWAAIEQQPDGGFQGTPAVTFRAPDGTPHYDLFAVSTTGAMEQSSNNSGQWGAWKGDQFGSPPHGAIFAGGVAAIYHDDHGVDHYDLFAIGNDGGVYQNAFRPWTGWKPLPGDSHFTGTPAVSYGTDASGTPRYDLFAVTTKGAMEQTSYRDGRWGDWKVNQFGSLPSNVTFPGAP